jgi:hypothetical protein
VTLASAGVFDELIVSIIRVKRISDLGTTIAVNSNQLRLVTDTVSYRTPLSTKVDIKFRRQVAVDQSV